MAVTHQCMFVTVMESLAVFIMNFFLDQYCSYAVVCVKYGFISYLNWLLFYIIPYAATIYC